MELLNFRLIWVLSCTVASRNSSMIPSCDLPYFVAFLVNCSYAIEVKHSLDLFTCDCLVLGLL